MLRAYWPAVCGNAMRLLCLWCLVCPGITGCSGTSQSDGLPAQRGAAASLQGGAAASPEGGTAASPEGGADATAGGAGSACQADAASAVAGVAPEGEACPPGYWLNSGRACGPPPPGEV